MLAYFFEFLYSERVGLSFSFQFYWSVEIMVRENQSIF